MKFLVSIGAQIIFIILAIGFIKTEDRNSLKRYTREWIKKYKEFNDILNSGAGKQTPHVSYLTPFPRVGRGGAVTWDLEPGYPRVPNALLLNNEERIRREGPAPRI
ncbi:hypothetical protein QE152_g3913 [Popillia japonica]|uniref:Uncharacterized protein n=1 Tax=Popillia japonica TaxID=7064 RepID=A0AAW1N4D3_POPJA